MRFEFQKKSACIAFACLAVGLLLTGCEGLLVMASHQCPPHPSVKVNGVDTQDLTMAAKAAVQSLLDSQVFERAPRHPAVLAIGKFFNETSQQLNTRLLTDEIKTALLKGGKVVVAEKEDSSSRSDGLSRPDFILSGRVAETSTRTGNIRQIAYVFSFSLADSKGLTVWAENKTITKQATRRNPGF